MTPTQAQTVAEIRERRERQDAYKSDSVAELRLLIGIAKRDCRDLLQIIDSQAAEIERLKSEAIGE